MTLDSLQARFEALEKSQQRLASELQHATDVVCALVCQDGHEHTRRCPDDCIEDGHSPECRHFHGVLKEAGHG